MKSLATPEERAEWERLALAGITIQDISLLTGYPRSTIYDHLTRQGFDTSRKRVDKSADIDAAIRMHGEGVALNAIAKRIGLSGRGSLWSLLDGPACASTGAAHRQHGSVLERFRERIPLARAIRLKCGACMGGDADRLPLGEVARAVDECASTTCPLWPFRFGPGSSAARAWAAIQIGCHSARSPGRWTGVHRPRARYGRSGSAETPGAR